MMWCVSFNLGFAEPSDVSSPSSIFGQKGFGWIVASITHLNRPPMDRLHRACQRQRRPQKGLLPRQTLRSSRVWPSVRTGSGPPPRPGPRPPLLLGSLGVVCDCWYYIKLSTNIAYVASMQIAKNIANQEGSSLW